ncbi:MAG: hypothetical protein GQ467_05580 [Mariprofundaceae bacterium]|nr:hypothetical protein [Mariprofundaceae bacterium]
MAQGLSAEEAKKLMETVSFELDADLRLHPHKLELGKAELLTDALTLPFMDIEERLNHFVLSASAAEKLALQKSMKAYLAKLNANPFIPLNFRLKVLGKFEKELELFDSEMTAAVLNAHKIGLDLVQKAARDEPSYYRPLVDMVSSALELAVKMLRKGLEEHRPPAVLTNRQTFDLMRLGLSVLPALPENTRPEQERLHKVISNHEFLRILDFYGKSDADKKMAWMELQYHISTLEPELIRKGGAAPEPSDETYLVTNMIRPNDTAKVADRIPDHPPYDIIFIPLNKFIDRMVTAIDRVERVIKSAGMTDSGIFTEEALHTTISGGNAILKTLRKQKRDGKRKDCSGIRLLLEWDVVAAFREAFSSIVDYEYAPSRAENRDSWAAMDVSKQGTRLERVGGVQFEPGVGAMIGLHWIPHHDLPMLGTIRWIRELKSGELQIGIKFLQKGFKIYQATLLGQRQEDDLSKTRTWPVLIKSGNPYHTAVFPDQNLYKNMTFQISDGIKGAHFQVAKVTEKGSNFSFCKLKLVKTLNKKQNMDLE